MALNPLIGLLQSLQHSPGPDKNFLRKNDQRAVLPPLEGQDSGKVLDPAKMQRQKLNGQDPRVIYDDQGNAVDYDLGKGPSPSFLDKVFKDLGLGKRSEAPGSQSQPGSQPKPNPLSGLISSLQGQGPGNGPGTLSGFLSRNLSPATATDSTTTTAQDPLSITPEPVSQQQPQPQPRYAQPTALPPEALPQLRNSLLNGAGLDPTLYLPSPETTRGVIKGNLSDEPLVGMDTREIPQGQGIDDFYNSIRGPR